MHFLALGSVSAFIGVAAGAFGAHILRDRLDAHMLQVWETAARYQMYHALALLFVALALHAHPELRLLRAGGWLFVLGTILFSGSLYAMALSGIRALGAITPLGGVAFLAGGWLFVLGTILFSGSLYAMALSGIRALGAITPLGGVAFLAGWIMLLIAGLRST